MMVHAGDEGTSDEEEGSWEEQRSRGSEAETGLVLYWQTVAWSVPGTDVVAVVPGSWRADICDAVGGEALRCWVVTALWISPMSRVGAFRIGCRSMLSG